MGILSRAIFREISASALLGALFFTFVLFLQNAGLLFKTLVNTSVTGPSVAWIFLLLIPDTLPLTLPLGTLVGVLIGLGRMSGDGEITALRASGVPSRRVTLPVMAFALLMMAVTAAASLHYTPLAIQARYRVINQLGAAQLSAEVQPRVFEESFPKTILYVGDVTSGEPVRWLNVILADMTPPEERKGGAQGRADSPRITVARQALAVADSASNRIQLSLLDSSTYEAAADPTAYYANHAPRGEQLLEARARNQERPKQFSAAPTAELRAAMSTSVEAAIEYHRRLALPLACLLLAIVGVPLGVSSRKGSKSAAFVVTVAFAFFYFMLLISLIGLAKERRLPPALAVWTPNAIFAATGLLLMFRLERPSARRPWEPFADFLSRLWSRLASLSARRAASGSSRQPRGRLPLLPQIVDTYILNTFLFYFFVLLASFVMLTELFNFFELLDDTFRNEIAMRKLFTYLFFLAPKLIYDAAPISVLVAVLVTFGILTRNNEINAMKACGVSLHRLCIPIFVICLILSGSLFAFDQYVVPKANLVQDALRAEIQGKAVQTFSNPKMKMIWSKGSRIFYYKDFDETQNMMVGVNVYDIDIAGMRLARHISAGRARWEPVLKTWIFQDGWARRLRPKDLSYQPFLGGSATFPEIDEPPNYFLKEVKTYKQMNAPELNSHIAELEQSGFNTIPLRVQYYRKFAVPLFAFILALLSAPFAFLTGGRGAMTGVGISLGVAVAYFAVNYLFEQLGNINQLTPEIAAWSPDVLFALAGVYLLANLRT